MNDNAEYWEGRHTARLLTTEDLAAVQIDLTHTVYQKAQKDIQEQVKSIYRNYAKKGVLPVSELKKAIGFSGKNEFLRKVKKMAEAMDLDPELVYDERYLFRLSRLQAIQEQIKMRILQMNHEEEKIADDFYSQVIRNNYNQVKSDLSELGITPAFSQIPDEVVDLLRRAQWKDSNYSDRIWANNTKTLSLELPTILGGAIASGQSYQKIARQIREQFDVKTYEATRLIRTEANYFNNQADIQAYIDEGIEYYEFNATLDSRTSNICRTMDRRTFKVTEIQVGENYPPLHPNCRSHTVGLTPDMIEEGGRKQYYRDPKKGISERFRRFKKFSDNKTKKRLRVAMQKQMDPNKEKHDWNADMNRITQDYGETLKKLKQEGRASEANIDKARKRLGKQIDDLMKQVPEDYSLRAGLEAVANIQTGKDYSLAPAAATSPELPEFSPLDPKDEVDKYLKSKGTDLDGLDNMKLKEMKEKFGNSPMDELSMKFMRGEQDPDERFFRLLGKKDYKDTVITSHKLENVDHTDITLAERKLREGDKLDPLDKEILGKLEKEFSKAKLKKDMYIYRGVAFNNKAGFTESLFQEGNIFEQDSYMFAGTIKRKAANYFKEDGEGGAMINIQAPAGTRAILGSDIGAGSDEILVDRDAKLEILSKKKVGDNRYEIEARILLDEYKPVKTGSVSHSGLDYKAEITDYLKANNLKEDDLGFKRSAFSSDDNYYAAIFQEGLADKNFRDIYFNDPKDLDYSKFNNNDLMTASNLLRKGNTEDLAIFTTDNSRSASGEPIKLAEVLGDLDKAFQESTTKKDMIFYRNISREGVLSADSFRGKIFVDQGYMFATLDKELAGKYGDISLEIEVPAGSGVINGASIGSDLLNSESIIDRGSVFDVISSKIEGDKLNVKLRLKTGEREALEAPQVIKETLPQYTIGNKFKAKTDMSQKELRLIKERGVTVANTGKRGQSKGHYNHSKREIVLQPTSKPDQMLHAFSHELGHVIDYKKMPDTKGVTTQYQLDALKNKYLLSKQDDFQKIFFKEDGRIYSDEARFIGVDRIKKNLIENVKDITDEQAEQAYRGSRVVFSDGRYMSLSRKMVNYIRSSEEIFAEGYAMYKREPKQMKKNAPQFYNYFNKLYKEL